VPSGAVHHLANAIRRTALPLATPSAPKIEGETITPAQARSFSSHFPRTNRAVTSRSRPRRCDRHTVGPNPGLAKIRLGRKTVWPPPRYHLKSPGSIPKPSRQPCGSARPTVSSPSRHHPPPGIAAHKIPTRGRLRLQRPSPCRISPWPHCSHGGNVGKGLPAKIGREQSGVGRAVPIPRPAPLPTTGDSCPPRPLPKVAPRPNCRWCSPPPAVRSPPHATGPFWLVSSLAGLGSAGPGSAAWVLIPRSFALAPPLDVPLGLASRPLLRPRHRAA
jgi:hypothetical protein